jgi:siroheme synthase (precorrin-2 oxidase/ferrochelatase)
VVVLVDPATDTDNQDIKQMLGSWFEWQAVSGPHAIADVCAPGDLDRWASRHCELVVLVTEQPEIARSVAQECQRRGIALCKLQLAPAETWVPQIRVA